MTINRNNYESYFLLYIDNELCKADKIMVEEFVQQHTDLRQELVMLQQTVLSPSVVSFEQKNNLLKTETAFQEKLLLHLDGELGVAEVAVLQNELQADNALRQEWELLQQTKLQPQDVVIFEHKEMLLRREPAPVIPAKWWRAAAAVLIGFGLAGTLLVLNNKNNKLAGGDTAKAITSGNNSTEIKENKIPVNPVAQQTDAVPQEVTAVQQNPAVSNIVKKDLPGTTANTKDVNSVVSEQKLVASSKEKDKLQKESSTIGERLENINKDKSNETVTVSVPLPESISQPAATETVKRNSLNGLAKPVIETSLKVNDAVYAATTKNDEAVQSDYLTPDDKKFRRSGLVRKVSRFFQRSTKKKADGDGLKIAGFEFAVR
jgi:hypothetical protein